MPWLNLFSDHNRMSHFQAEFKLSPLYKTYGMVVLTEFSPTKGQYVKFKQWRISNGLFRQTEEDASDNLVGVSQKSSANDNGITEQYLF